MLRIAFAAAIAAAVLVVAGSAEARVRRHVVAHGCGELDVMRGLCLGSARPRLVRRAARAGRALKRGGRYHHGRAVAARPGASYAVSAQILPHPAGCPGRAFCGCGAAVRIWGQPIRALWLAAAWYKFPRSAPAPGRVAVRPHHVFVLEQHLGGSTWLVYDANSGGRATRLHARSIDGYTIVDPQWRMAQR